MDTGKGWLTEGGEDGVKHPYMYIVYILVHKDIVKVENMR